MTAVMCHMGSQVRGSSYRAVKIVFKKKQYKTKKNQSGSFSLEVLFLQTTSVKRIFLRNF